MNTLLCCTWPYRQLERNWQMHCGSSASSVIIISVSKRKELCKLASKSNTISLHFKSTKAISVEIENKKKNAAQTLEAYKNKKIGEVMKKELSRVNQTRNHIVPEKKLLSKKEIYTFAPEFEDKMRDWKRLLGLELEAEKEKIKSMDGIRILAATEFSFKACYYSIAGRILELKFRSKLSNDDFLKISSFCRKGMPFQLFINQKEAAEQSISKDSVQLIDNDSTLPIETVFMDITKEVISVKVKNDRFKLDEEQKKWAFFKLNMSDDKMPLKNLLDLISDRKSWLNYPGYKLLLYAYRAKQLPISTSCRKHKLSEEFNTEQCEAIRAALNIDRPITAIHGPPGTGKTKVIAEIVAEMVKQKKKVLVCAPSHKAVFNVLKYCCEKGLESYCKIHGEERDFTKNINYLVETHLLGNSLNNVYDKMNQPTGITADKDLLDLHKQSKLMQKNIRQSIAEEIRVLFCTVASISVRQLFDLGFNPDLVILDEAGQTMECESWPMIFQANRVIVVGDHKQLPAVVSSEEAKKGGLDVSLIEWISKSFGQDVNYPLSIQHRFNSAIQSWPNKEFYNQRLKAHYTVSNIRLKDIFPKDTKKREETNEQIMPLVDDPLVLVDTDLLSLEHIPLLNKLYVNNITRNIFVERQLCPSIYNLGEALICAQHLKALLKKLSSVQMGCITPYLAQIHKIKGFLPSELASQLEISTVDAFQGQEREAIIMSFVRNNRDQNLGFLSEFRRLNVAITRAKRQFLLVASGRMLRSDSVLNRFLETVQYEGRVISPSDILLPLNKIENIEESL